MPQRHRAHRGLFGNYADYWDFAESLNSSRPAPFLLVVHGMDDPVNDLTKRIIGCAIEVHRALGPGLQERTYENAMAIELREHHLPFDRQVCVPVAYKGEWVGDYRLDLVVSDAVIVEIKSVERGDPLFEAQVLAYLRASGKHVGLLINFNSQLLTQGVRRFVV